MSSLSCDVEVTSPLYKYLQIELTNRCNLRCDTCIRAIPDSVLQEQDLSEFAIRQLKPALHHTRSVHLQGWGEPMLLTDLPERIHWFKVQKCKVSFTTNGSLMAPGQAAELVASGLDSITFSMAGASAPLQDSLRGKGSHAKLWQSMQLLREAKRQQGSETPSMAVSYLLTKETIIELPKAVKRCRPLGLSLFAGVHLTHPATSEQEAMRLYPLDRESSFKRLIRRAHWHAFWGGMRLQLPAFRPDLTPICDKNPLAGCFIAADGSVAPCVFLHPPPSNIVNAGKHIMGSIHQLAVSRKSFGSLHEESLDHIWNKAEYRSFRNVFRRRLKFYNKEIGRVGCGMDAFAKLDLTRSRVRQVFKRIPVPDCCRNCPKMEGY